MRRGLAVAAVLTATTAAGCAGGGSGPVVEGTPPATPYSGPLHVASRHLDQDSVRAVRLSAGAAGRALECDGRIYSGDAGGEWGKGDGGTTPEEGLTAYFDLDGPEVPRHGYRVERREAGRVLFSYDVHGRTKVAVVVAEDRAGAPGWGPESSASCDPAELPASFTDGLGLEIWTDADGHRVPTTTLSGYAGAEHCDWQDVRFLAMGRGAKAAQYVRDPEGVLDGAGLTAAYDGKARLPKDAHDTGYRLGERELWLTADRSTAYVRTSDGVEAWPRAKRFVACM
ncbi:hypothetical protein ABZT03_35660 [Streptomyces sp. NPDC005574]|uniref:hypothetical protein n=1 Tax=Streptomyces sp. NPDC005574 TaxID=3156891 RepID=UPI00339E442E